MVLAFCRLTGMNSTVPPKSVPSITSIEPLICPWWEVLMWFDSEVVAWVSGAAETVDYFG